MKHVHSRVALGELATISYGYTASASVEPVGPQFLRITDIQQDSVNWATVPRCRIGGGDLPRYLLADGDIVFARTGATTGKSFLVKNPPESVFASYLIRLRVRDGNLLPEFLSRYFQTPDYWGAINEGSTGSAQGGFNASKLAALHVPVPQIPEQRRIVKILDEAFAGITEAKARAEQNRQNSRALFESELHAIFRVRGRGWVDTTVDRLSTNLDSRRVPITKSDRKAGPYPYYGASGVVDHVAEYIFDEETLLVSEDGANLIARSTPIAFSVSGKYWVNNHAHILKFPHRATQRYVEFYLGSIKLDDFITGAAQPKLNQAALNSIPIPIPNSVDEQAKIVSRVEALSAGSEQLQAVYARKLAALDELKASLLHQAFSGRL